MIFRNGLLLSAIAGIGLLGTIGCEYDHPHHHHVVVEEGPPPPPQEEVIVVDPPPPARVEVRPVAPYHDAVWIPGYYGYRDRRYVWIDGRWDRGPRPGAVWVQDRWEHTPHGYRHVVGHWQ